MPTSSALRAVGEYTHDENKNGENRPCLSTRHKYEPAAGKKYVGSAYGEHGIWNRWCCYVDSLHGNNKKLKELFGDGKDNSMLKIFQGENPIDYVRDNFRFTLLECWPFNTDDTAIIHRENFWKEALLSRGEFGYNAN